ncbi:2-phosphosulfolactate phosphatase [Roseomonas sp. GC11]|uniref:2-phosphosulfolactate phosphatase n=1 Tax=Roseomonas sp. GC11 TaxID=2950546 RepID=UPI00210A7967|nr:2-phosphosulfolactate phosphatase [Roseomonas sp. GC11]MCQ4162106.1 2-phosphosulfolactate phosphatase [Roseomonas sp. GC11]
MPASPPCAESLCEWGIAGLEALREAAAVFVIVDVLSFCTAVDAALGRGGSVIPFASGDPGTARRAAEAAGALLAGRRGEGGFSLSPPSLLGLPAGARLLLPSPNGARLSATAAALGRPVLAGCLRNAAAVARAAQALAGMGAIALIPAGEHWPDGRHRPAIEDWLGAGAILHHLGEARPATAEAALAREAFRAARDRLPALLRGCRSGQELTGRGFPQDVEMALALDASPHAPLLHGGAFSAA